jgi:hypothetical protein
VTEQVYMTPSARGATTIGLTSPGDVTVAPLLVGTHVAK